MQLPLQDFTTLVRNMSATAQVSCRHLVDLTLGQHPFHDRDDVLLLVRKVRGQGGIDPGQRLLHGYGVARPGA